MRYLLVSMIMSPRQIASTTPFTRLRKRRAVPRPHVCRLRVDLRGMLALHHARFVCCCGRALHSPILLGRHEQFHRGRAQKQQSATADYCYRLDCFLDVLDPRRVRCCAGGIQTGRQRNFDSICLWAKECIDSKCDTNNVQRRLQMCVRPCQGLGLIVQIWLYLCPAFPFTVFLLSSPVTILVALWGMTTDSFLESLGWKWAGFRFGKKATLGDGLKSFIKAGGEP